MNNQIKAVPRASADGHFLWQEFFRHLPSLIRQHRLVTILLKLGLLAPFQKIRFNGNARVVVDLRDADARNYFLKRAFEPEFFSIALPFLSDDCVMFDVGANFGFCTFGVLQSLRSSKLQVHLFEANGALCDCLRTSAVLYPDQAITITFACVSDKASESKLGSSGEIKAGRG